MSAGRKPQNQPFRLTEAVRRTLRDSPESLRALAKRYGVNQKTVAKWRKRSSLQDLPSGRPRGRGASLTIDEQKMAALFRQHTRLPLDDCLHALQARIPHLTRSSLHRCFQRHGISRLTRHELPRRKKRAPPIGCFSVNAAVVDTARGEVILFSAVDQTSKYLWARSAPKASGLEAVKFIEALAAVVPYPIHTIHAEPYVHFVASGPRARPITSGFETAYFKLKMRSLGIEHVLAEPRRNSMVSPILPADFRDAVDRAAANVQFESREHLDAFAAEFLIAFTYKRRLKSLGGLTPYEYVHRVRSVEPESA